MQLRFIAGAPGNQTRFVKIGIKAPVFIPGGNKPHHRVDALLLLVMAVRVLGADLAHARRVASNDAPGRYPRTTG